MSELTPEDQAVIDAADTWRNEGAWSSMQAIWKAVDARRAALQPVRRTWTITTERRAVRNGDSYMDHDDPSIIYRATSDWKPPQNERHVVVSVEPRS